MELLPSDILRIILLQVDDDNLLTWGLINNRFYQIYSSDYFWQLRINKLIGHSYDISMTESSWKKLYLSLIRGGKINIIANETIIIGNCGEENITIETNSYVKKTLLDNRNYLTACYLVSSVVALSIEGTLTVILGTGYSRSILTDIKAITSLESDVVYLTKKGEIGYLSNLIIGEIEPNLLFLPDIVPQANIKISVVGNSNSNLRDIKAWPIISQDGNIHIMNKNRISDIFCQSADYGKIVSVCAGMKWNSFCH